MKASLTDWAERWKTTSGVKARLEELLRVAVVLVEIYAVYWVLTAWRFEAVIPVYQQF